MLRRILLGARNDSQKSYSFSDVGLECETRVGSDMAPMDCDCPTAIDHRPPRLWQSLAPARRPPLDLQDNSAPVFRAVIIVADYARTIVGRSTDTVSCLDRPANESLHLVIKLPAQPADLAL